jgi:hypothetical protein
MSSERLTELVIVIIMAISIALSFFFNTISTILLILISIWLTILYIRLYPKIKQEPLPKLNIVSYIVCAIPTLLSIPASLFKIMHWPGASIFLLASYFTAFVAVILICTSYIIQLSRNHKPSLIPYLILFIPFLLSLKGTAAFSKISERNIKEDVINKITVETAQVEKLARSQQANNSILSALVWGGKNNNDTLVKIHNSTSELYNYIEMIKRRIIDNSGGRNEDGSLVGKFETTTVEIYLLGPEGTKAGEAYKLEKEIKSFYATVGANKNSLNNSENIDLAHSYFSPGTSTAEALLTLSRLQLEVLQVEEEYYLSLF